MDTFSSKIAGLLEENVGPGKKYQNYRQLAEAVGTSHTTFTFLTQGRIKNPNPALLRRISKALAGDGEYLVEVYARTTLGIKQIRHPAFREKAKPYGAGQFKPLSEASEVHYSVGCVPIITSLFEQDPASVENLPALCADSTVVHVADAKAFALFLEDDSMSPRYLDGDCVIASASSQLRPNSPVLFKLRGQNIKCRLFKDLGDSIALIPVNPGYELISCQKKDVIWMYPVIMSYRMEK